MSELVQDFATGELVRARGREWIVLGIDGGLRVRPLTGSENEVELLQPELELEPITGATFPAPNGSRTGGREAAQLLRDALRLSLRRGAGPFRSFGNLSVEPRAYQLVPLLMALKQDIVRLLVADDVGVGKTIEAGLIAREMLDRGEPMPHHRSGMRRALTHGVQSAAPTRIRGIAPIGCPPCQDRSTAAPSNWEL